MKISVILTAYNAAAYLREALDSILAQDYQDWEAICIDDGSTDATAAILDDYAQRDSRFKVSHHENRRLAACRNEGVRLATGDYLTFCDADDIVTPFWFSNAARLIAETKPDLLRARLLFAKDMPADFCHKRTARVEQVVSGQHDCLQWGWRVFFPAGFVVIDFIKAELKPFVNFPEHLIVKEDSTMAVCLAPHLTQIVQSDCCGYFYRNTQSSLLRKKRVAKASVLYLNALADIWHKQKDLAVQLGLLGDLRRAVQKYADNDVIDWAIACAHESRDEKLRVHKAWEELRDAGAFDGRYSHRFFLYLPFLWWKITGRESLLTWTWALFLFVRKLLLRK